MQDYIQQLRRDFSQFTLDENSAERDPFQQFSDWLREAIEARVNEPNAMTLATATPDGIPSARIVLLRGFDRQGFSFYTNYNSKKGKELLHNPYGALVFFWPELERQVRIDGTISKQTTEASDEYFMSRPRESRLGAWTSPQSEVIPNRDYLDKELEKTTKDFDEKEVHRPEWWGGYVLKPTAVEFWQGRPSRLHDRLLYSLDNDVWKIERLAP